MQAIHEYDVQADIDDKAQVIVTNLDSKEYAPGPVAGKYIHVLTCYCFTQLILSDPPSLQKSSQTSINTIPAELIEEIMRQLSPCMRTCLGLTCRKMYKHFKYVNPGTVGLMERADPEDWKEHSLFRLLEDWMGPEYRRGRREPYHYLLRSVYGYFPGSVKELELSHRYSDYVASRQGTRARMGSVSLCTPMLPNPYNKGDNWNKEAIAVIEEDLLIQLDSKGWIYCWEDYYIWTENEEYFLRVAKERSQRVAEAVLLDGTYAEWIDLIGF